MGISEKEAFRILGLPLGVDKDAINDRYKSMSNKLSASKSPDDKKKLELVIAAYSQLIPRPPPRAQPQNKNNRNPHTKSQPILYDDDDSDEESSEAEWMVCTRNGDARNHISKVNQDLTETEKDRRRAEKRRAKKKRRKEKKKIENQTQNQNFNDDKREESDSEEDDDDEEEIQGLDPNSAFVAMAAGKKIGNSRGAVSKQEEKRKTLNKSSSQDDEEATSAGLDTLVLQSRQLAIRGNEAANVGQYTVAVRLFTEAIRLDPNDHRFFGNRSYCYDQLGQHEKALKDAERAIKIAPQWPKGHYRRGTSLRGLG
ncbi:Ttc31p, partial [Halocaridina rubra]